MAYIRHHYYAAKVDELAADPIVQGMLADLEGVPDYDLMHVGTRTPLFAFMTRANHVYRERGGQIDAHIGGVAEALLKLRAERTEHT
ncbi:hypothetical protein, partial [Planotetraspora phitsanulokensis]